MFIRTEYNLHRSHHPKYLSFAVTSLLTGLEMQQVEQLWVQPQEEVAVQCVNE